MPERGRAGKTTTPRLDFGESRIVNHKKVIRVGFLCRLREIEAPIMTVSPLMLNRPPTLSAPAARLGLIPRAGNPALPKRKSPGR